MRVSVFGLGYVGAVSSGCFANDGHDVVGVDMNPTKVAMLNEGRSPVVEDGVSELLRAGVDAGRLSATTDGAAAVRETEVSVIAVGTPSAPNGSLSLAAVTRVCEQIGTALAAKETRHLVVVRSTVLPGTTRGTVVPTLASASGKAPGQGFGVCFNPEFLREGSSVTDYYNPPYTLVGCDVPDDGEQVGRLYHAVAGDVHHVALETAEMVKYVANTFHALKISFANEVGGLAHALGVDGHEVMDLICRDTKLNISSRYLKPGFAFGGSCLPKDVRAMVHRARTLDLELPVVQAVLESNRRLVDRVIGDVLSLKPRRVALLGLSFKAGTDDLRESPLVTVAEALLGKGVDVRIYDEAVATARLVGANKDYIDKEIPHLSSLLGECLDTVVTGADVVVIGNAAPAFRELPRYLKPGQTVLDFVRLGEVEEVSGIDYRGIAW